MDYNNTPTIKISIIIPVFNCARFVGKTVLSALSQTYPDVEVIIYDDCSTDPLVRKILLQYHNHPRARLIFGKTNLGISMATNQAIIRSAGDYLAFLDCDDILSPNAIETAAQYIQLHPDVSYFYSNRENIDEEGKIINRMDFSHYTGKSPREQILTFMFASHLKVIKKSVFFEVGLFKKEYDSCQDYDMALRLSGRHKFFHIPEYLYQYRIHSGQVSQAKKRDQAVLSYHARDVEVVRRQIYSGHIGRKKISIIMLTMNRWKRTKASLELLVKNTTLPYELIILDNNSSDDTAQMLKWFAGQKDNVKIILEKENLGQSGGRKKALQAAGGDFIVTLDNDIGVGPRWLENLLVRLKEAKADAACCRVLLPDGKIQYNGGHFDVKEPFITFSFIDNSMKYNSLDTLIFRECRWLPGGATIYRRPVFDRVAFCEELRGGMEDNDLSLQMNKAGLKMVNSPLSTVVHYHTHHEPQELQDPEYLRRRYNWEQLKTTLSVFYKRHGLIIYDPWLFDKYGIPGDGAGAIEFFRKQYC
ncbi:MAG: glycosyltransferase family 2 protein [Bacillota bacterium]